MSKIIIIGAGIAGIAAASALYKDGFSDVIILEAQDYVGGRIRSVPFGSGSVELGAEYIHGADGNPLYRIAMEHDCLDEEQLLQTDENYFHYSEFRCFNGTLFPNIDAYQIMNIVDNVRDKKIFKNYMRSASEKRKSLETVCDMAMEEYLTKPCELSYEAKVAHKSLYKWYKNFTSIESGSYYLSDISVNEFDLYEKYPGHLYNSLTTSYSELLDPFLWDIPKSAIKLSSPVSEIYWQTDAYMSKQSNTIRKKLEDRQSEIQREYPAVIRCEGGETYSADHVIMTASLGFLQNNIGALFYPSLPPSKISAFLNLSFGNVAKLFLQFDKPPMDNHIRATHFLWPVNKPVTLQCARTSIKMKDGREWYECFVTCDVQRDDKVLLLWVNGEAAVAVNSIPEQELKEVCQEILQKFLGRPDIALPTAVITSDWHKNKYVCGTYSYMGTASKPAHRRELSKPEPSAKNPVLIFAGEAVSMHHFSTAHGAMETGIDAATKIIHMHKSKQ